MKKSCNEIYIVEKGDTIGSIAERNNVNPTTILLANNLTPAMIKPGRALYIKKGEE